MQFQYLSQDEIDGWIQKIVNQISKSGKKYDYVVGIENGGKYIGQSLSQALDLPYKSVRISFYDDPNVQGVHNPDFKFRWAPNGLLADDLIDKGATISEFKRVFGEIDVAVLLWAKNAPYYRQKPEYYAVEKPDAWIVFPWEDE